MGRREGFERGGGVTIYSLLLLLIRSAYPALYVSDSYIVGKLSSILIFIVIGGDCILNPEMGGGS